MFTKDFFKDKLIILLGGITLLLTGINTALVLLQAELNQASITFRHWIVNGNSQFDTAEPSYIYLFIFMALIVLISSVSISYKIYDYFRPAAYTTFVLGHVVLLANILIAEIIITL